MNITTKCSEGSDCGKYFPALSFLTRIPDLSREVKLRSSMCLCQNSREFGESCLLTTCWCSISTRPIETVLSGFRQRNGNLRKPLGLGEECLRLEELKEL